MGTQVLGRQKKLQSYTHHNSFQTVIRKCGNNLKNGFATYSFKTFFFNFSVDSLGHLTYALLFSIIILYEYIIKFFITSYLVAYSNTSLSLLHIKYTK